MRGEAVEQVAHGGAAVAEGVLQCRIQLGGGLLEFGQPEQRVVAEAALAARGGEDLGVPLAVGDQRARVLGVAHEHHGRVEVGCALSRFGEM